MFLTEFWHSFYRLFCAATTTRPIFVKTILFFWRIDWGRLTALFIHLLLLSGFAAIAQTTTVNCPPAQCIPIAIRRLPLPPPVSAAVTPPISNTTTPPSPLLKTPLFEPQGGNYAYGSRIQIKADNAPSGSVIERSWDNGVTWTAGTEFTLLWNGTFLARLRQNDQVSDVVRANFGVFYERLFILGNSIMRISPVLEIGWNQNNGMAASAPEKDFVHLLQNNLRALNSPMQTRLIGGSGFENKFWEYNFSTSLDEHLRDYKPDLVIVRIGENVSETEVNSRDNREVFRQKYNELLDKLTQFSGGNVKVICTTSFWNNPRSREIIVQEAAKRGYPVADIYGELYNRTDHTDFTATQYAMINAGVAAHPNDRGHSEIARLIWDKILAP